jgi:hypothetical protein
MGRCHWLRSVMLVAGRVTSGTCSCGEASLDRPALDSKSLPMAFDELRRCPDRVSVPVIASATVEGVIEVDFSPAIFVVVSHEQDGLADE